MRSRMKQDLTTGEASKVLGVSIRTVIRYFDKGIVTGLRNPATRYRMVDRKSIKALEALKRKRANTIRKAVDDFAERRSKRQGLTTGEVSRMLGMPRDRVVTLFDQGTLTGYKHPVRGWMVIDRESVEALAKESGIELSEPSSQ